MAATEELAGSQIVANHLASIAEAIEPPQESFGRFGSKAPESGEPPLNGS